MHLNGFLYNLTTKKTILEVSEKDRIQSFENGVIQICRTPPYAYPEIYEFYNELGIRLSVMSYHPTNLILILI